MRRSDKTAVRSETAADTVAVTMSNSRDEYTAEADITATGINTTAAGCDIVTEWHQQKPTEDSIQPQQQQQQLGSGEADGDTADSKRRQRDIAAAADTTDDRIPWWDTTTNNLNPPATPQSHTAIQLLSSKGRRQAGIHTVPLLIMMYVLLQLRLCQCTIFKSNSNSVKKIDYYRRDRIPISYLRAGVQSLIMNLLQFLSSEQTILILLFIGLIFTVMFTVKKG